MRTWKKAHGDRYRASKCEYRGLFRRLRRARSRRQHPRGEYSDGRPSRRMCPLSRKIPVPDHRTIAPMAMPSDGSTHCAPVERMTIAPAKIAILESASPKLCSHTVRTFKSRRPRWTLRGDASVDRQGQKKNPHHQPCSNRDRMTQARQRFTNQKNCRQREHRGIHKRRENAGPVIPERLSRVGGRRPSASPARKSPAWERP